MKKTFAASALALTFSAFWPTAAITKSFTKTKVEVDFVIKK